jgi:hypothetical protein
MSLQEYKYFTKKKDNDISPTVLGIHAEATRFWSSEGGPYIKARREQNTKGYETLPAGGEKENEITRNSQRNS